MITNLQYLGIYPDAIDGAIETCENALKMYNFTTWEIDDMNEHATEILADIGRFDDITNSIIKSYFWATADALQKKFKVETDWFVNCDDSHFYIIKDGTYEEVY